VTELEILPRLHAQYGVPGPARWIVVLFVDEAGNVGGYRAGLAIMDSPLSYFDAAGTPLGTFHIFGTPEENAAAHAALAALQTRFPIERLLVIE
jgi:hypothetical protein